MDMTTRQLLFGSAHASDPRGVFAPRGAQLPQKGDVLATFRGFGRNGAGREKGLEIAERLGMISAEQRAAGGPVADAASATVARGNVQGMAAAPAAATAAGAAVAGEVPQYANPVYNGVYAQMLMRETGFVPPMEAVQGLPAGGAAQVIETTPVAAAPIVAEAAPEGAIASAAADAAEQLAAQERRLLESFDRIAHLPQEQKLPALATAVDATAAAGHGDDAFTVLATSLASRPPGASADAIHATVDDLERAAVRVADDVVHAATPLADEVAKVVAPASEALAKSAAPVADDVMRVVEAAVPKVVEAAVPKVVEAAIPALAHAGGTRSLLAAGAADALHGVMPFAAGVDDTLRLLARARP